MTGFCLLFTIFDFTIRDLDDEGLLTKERIETQLAWPTMEDRFKYMLSVMGFQDRYSGPLAQLLHLVLLAQQADLESNSGDPIDTVRTFFTHSLVAITT